MYDYPIDPSWSYEELLAVMDLLVCVEKAYEGGVNINEVAKCYKVYKDLGFTISDEKQLNKEFETVTKGYSLHALLVACKKGDKQKISLKVQ